MQSDKPFHKTIESLIDIAGMSQRELGRRASEHGGRFTFSTLNRIITGETKVTPEVMEILARTLHIEPETFAEYRLWKTRRIYDPSEVGFKAAVQNLRRLEAGEAESVERHSPQAHLRTTDDEDQAAST